MAQEAYEQMDDDLESCNSRTSRNSACSTTSSERRRVLEARAKAAQAVFAAQQAKVERLRAQEEALQAQADLQHLQVEMCVLDETRSNASKSQTSRRSRRSSGSRADRTPSTPASLGSLVVASTDDPVPIDRPTPRMPYIPQSSCPRDVDTRDGAESASLQGDSREATDAEEIPGWDPTSGSDMDREVLPDQYSINAIPDLQEVWLARKRANLTERTFDVAPVVEETEDDMEAEGEAPAAGGHANASAWLS